MNSFLVTTRECVCTAITACSNVLRDYSRWSFIGLGAIALTACGSGDASAPTGGEPPPAPPPVTTAGSPQIYYTDIVSGPTTGGENNKGIYLSIFGKDFGSSGLGSTVKVYIGGIEVDNYRFLGTSKGRSDIQQITVQIGALGSPTPGVALPIKVIVGSSASNTDLTFTPNPGRILFVDNVAGNDSTAAIGDIGKPYRHVQTPTLSAAAWGQVRAGDFIIMRGHGSSHPWTDVGFENYFMRYRDKSGSAPTGAAGTGPIVLMGYPTEDVYLRGTLANGMSGGCVSAINGQSYPDAGKWAVVTNLRIDCEGYDGPISQEIYGDHWRVVNNDLSASTAPTSGTNVPRMAGITGNGTGSVWLGNHIHDVQGSADECHGIYIDGDGSYEIAYNHIHDIRSGNGLQVYVNGGNGSDVANNVSFHHNLVHDVNKHGLNIADGSKNNFVVYDNVVYNTQRSGIRFNTLDLHGAKFYNNTFYNTVTGGNTAYGALSNDWTLPSDAYAFVNNIFYVAPSTPYTSGSVGFSSANGFTKNLWFGGSATTTPDTGGVFADPQFVANGTDFHLQASSPAIDTGNSASAVTTLVTTDYELTTPRPRGSGIDIGAYER